MLVDSVSDIIKPRNCVSNCSEGERLVIELGRALRKGEYKCKVFFMRLADCIAPEFKYLQPVCDYILCTGADVGSTKRAIIAQLASTDPKYSTLTYESCRLRMKSFRSPMDVYTDEQKFGEDINMSTSDEVNVEMNAEGGSVWLNDLFSMFFTVDFARLR